MKCQVLLINRGRTKYIKRAKFDNLTIIAKRKKYYIPKDTKYLELERTIGTIPLWLVDETTTKALGYSFISDNKKAQITIGAEGDATTNFKLNVLAKTSFWEMLAKKLKLSVIQTIIYLCAGGGIFLLAIYIIKLIFLKESSI